MNRRFELLAVSLLVAALLIHGAFAWLGLANTHPLPLLAQGTNTSSTQLNAPTSLKSSLTVCPAGPPTCGYTTIQAAVDAAAVGDIIKVAAGVYSDLHSRPAPAGYSGSSVITQVVYLTKPVTIQGGYTTSFIEPPNPTTNPTLLDAQGGGRVLFVMGSDVLQPVVRGLRFTGGNAHGLGGYHAGNAGGGIYIRGMAVTLSDNQILSNTAQFGGGVFVHNGAALLAGNHIVDNVAAANGGGFFLSAFEGTLRDNTIRENRATTGSGGGGFIFWGAPMLANNTLLSNTASIDGGALYVDSSLGPINENLFAHNRALNHHGGAIYMHFASPSLRNNVFSRNVAQEGGGALYIWDGQAMLTNNVLADNEVMTGWGSGIFFEAGATRLLHTTVARNRGGEGVGIFVHDSWGNPAAVWMTNTIVVSQSIGIYATTGANNSARLNGVLWYGNTANVGTGLITVTGAITGNPAFAADGYHLLPTSAARDAGVASGLAFDIDQHPRPDGAGYDLGADEYFVPRCYARLNNGTIYNSVQAAVDASTSSADIVKVAGYCSGIHTRDGLAQLVTLNKTLTLRGGYTLTNWTTPHPVAHPTVLDAVGLGRVLYVAGQVAPTIEGLTLMRGNASGLRGLFNGDAGGGVYVLSATATIKNCNIRDNIASSTGNGFGGGLCLNGSAAQLQGNTVQGNTSSMNHSGHGGGIYLNNSPALLQNNTVQGNMGSIHNHAQGGGLYLRQSSAQLDANTILSNTASIHGYASGGGAYLFQSPAILQNNLFQGNIASQERWADGGGLYLTGSDALLSANRVRYNIAGASLSSGGTAGGMYIESSSATLRGNTIEGNIAGRNDEGWGGGLYLSGGAPLLEDNQIVANRGCVQGLGLGGGILVYEGEPMLVGNTIRDNIAGNSEGDRGGGIYLDTEGGGLTTLIANQIVNNTASLGLLGYGGGLMSNSSPFVMERNLVWNNTTNADGDGYGGGIWAVGPVSFTLTNNVVAGNQAINTADGMGIVGEYGRAQGVMIHNTIASNLGNGDGIYIGSDVTLSLTNTIIVGHRHIGITVSAGSTATLEATLWYENGSNWSGAGAISVGTVNIYDAPAFRNPAAGDYHLTLASAALDAGIDAGVTVDLDSQRRPIRGGFDIGADEIPWDIFLPLVCRNK